MKIISNIIKWIKDRLRPRPVNHIVRNRESLYKFACKMKEWDKERELEKLELELEKANEEIRKSSDEADAVMMEIEKKLEEKRW